FTPLFTPAGFSRSVQGAQFSRNHCSAGSNAIRRRILSALPPKATSIAFFGMSALGQKRTICNLAETASIRSPHRRRTAVIVAERLRGLKIGETTAMQIVGLAISWAVAIGIIGIGIGYAAKCAELCSYVGYRT